MHEWSIHDLARHAGVSSRALRHYGERGLLTPSRTGPGGYRYYDDAGLVRLQRILLLRELGLGLAEIGDVLGDETDVVAALREHVRALSEEHRLLGRRIDAVRATVARLERGEPLMADESFDGFDHTRHREEVIDRWGRDAYEASDRWWSAQSADEQAEFRRDALDLATAWQEAARAGLDPGSDEVAALAERHVAWLAGTPGTPAHGRGTRRGEIDETTRCYVLGLADVYVADDRFAANYGGTSGAEFVREALRAYVGS